jgi:hypothetical protein
MIMAARSMEIAGPELNVKRFLMVNSSIYCHEFKAWFVKIRCTGAP